MPLLRIRSQPAWRLVADPASLNSSTYTESIKPSFLCLHTQSQPGMGSNPTLSRHARHLRSQNTPAKGCP
eukprot:4752426-Pyramimonas_sp.AAC.1